MSRKRERIDVADRAPPLNCPSWSLSTDFLKKICVYCDVTTLGRISQCSKWANTISTSDEIWDRLFARDKTGIWVCTDRLSTWKGRYRYASVLAHDRFHIYINTDSKYEHIIFCPGIYRLYVTVYKSVIIEGCGFSKQYRSLINSSARSVDALNLSEMCEGNVVLKSKGIGIDWMAPGGSLRNISLINDDEDDRHRHSMSNNCALVVGDGNLTLTNCSLTGTKHAMKIYIQTRYPENRVTMEGCLIYNSHNIGCKIDNVRFKMRNSIVVGCGSTGLEISQSNVEIENSIICSNRFSGVRIMSETRDSASILTVSNCVLTDNFPYAIHVFGYVDLKDLSRCIITHNKTGVLIQDRRFKSLEEYAKIDDFRQSKWSRTLIVGSIIKDSIFMSNVLDIACKPSVNNNLLDTIRADGKCTTSAYYTKYISQEWYQCITCNLTKSRNLGCCSICANHHRDSGHIVEFLKLYPLFYCDCPFICGKDCPHSQDLFPE